MPNAPPTPRPPTPTPPTVLPLCMRLSAVISTSRAARLPPLTLACTRSPRPCRLPMSSAPRALSDEAPCDPSVPCSAASLTFSPPPICFRLPKVPPSSDALSPVLPTPASSNDAAPPIPVLSPAPPVMVTISTARSDAALTATVPLAWMSLSSTLARTLLPRIATDAPAPTPVPAIPTPSAPENEDRRRISSATTLVSVATTAAFWITACVSFSSRCTWAMPATPAPPASAPLTATPLKSERLRALTSNSRLTVTFVVLPAWPTRACVVLFPRLTNAVPATAAPKPAAPAPPTSEAALSLLAVTSSEPLRRVPPTTLARVLVLKSFTTPVAAPPTRPAAAPTAMASAFWLALAATVTPSAAFTVAPLMEASLLLSNRLVDNAPAPENTPGLPAIPAT
ncbi:hypothetical protein D3C81_489880 [compost metagenome]